MSSKKMHMDAIDTLLYQPYKLENFEMIPDVIAVIK